MKAHWCNFRRDSGYVRLTPDDGWLFLLLFNSYHPRQSISIALGMQRRKMINTDPWGMLCVWSRLRENEEGHSRWGARRTKRVLVPPQRLPFLQKQECLCRNHRIFEIWPPPKPNRIRWSAKYHESEEKSGINCGLKPAIIGRRF